VSWTIKPVTQIADVDVKIASIRDVPFPSAVATGSISRIVPITMKIKKLILIVTPGFAGRFLIVFLSISLHWHKI
jgi:hypothetical protein